MSTDSAVLASDRPESAEPTLPGVLGSAGTVLDRLDALSPSDAAEWLAARVGDAITDGLHDVVPGLVVLLARYDPRRADTMLALLEVGLNARSPR